MLALFVEFFFFTETIPLFSRNFIYVDVGGIYVDLRGIYVDVRGITVYT